jgi:hypothetical protein
MSSKADIDLIMFVLLNLGMLRLCNINGAI